jgi:quercetin dioxygenase-like cupin family protein
MPTEPSLPAFLTNGPEIVLPVAGARGWLVEGGQRQVVLVEFAKDAEVPTHSHAAQWEIALAGRVELHRAGATEHYEAGAHFFVPAGQPHAATVHAGYRALIVFDEPDRYTLKRD